jgi:hypothetical protein
LNQLDPVAAARMEHGNRRRIVRALEVIELTGRRFSSFGPGIDDYPAPAISVTMLGLRFAAPDLAARIARRFDRMRQLGLVEEVGLLAETALSRTAREAIGYRELLAYFAGQIETLDDAFDAAVRRTRRFARRQRTWFGRDPRVQWIDGTRPVRGCRRRTAPLVRFRPRCDSAERSPALKVATATTFSCSFALDADEPELDSVVVAASTVSGSAPMNHHDRPESDGADCSMSLVNADGGRAEMTGGVGASRGRGPSGAQLRSRGHTAAGRRQVGLGATRGET